MLQQTVVAAVVPRFEAWLSRYPSASALASAPIAEVLRAWEGLGYYSRARNLHAAAQIITDRHAGRIPGTRDELIALPGIGDYTAAAILSIAFGLPYAVLDANVKRVAQRLLGLRHWTRASERRIRAFLDERMTPRTPGDFNEAMMELGALICTPRSPRCGECPVAAGCAARRLGLTATIPSRRTAKVTATVSTVVVALSGGRVWVVPGSHALRGGRTSGARGTAARARKSPPPAGVFLAGLSCFPRREDCLPSIAERVSGGAVLPDVVHAYLTVRESIQPVMVRLPRRVAVTRIPGRWIPLSRLEDEPMPSAYRRIARAVPGASRSSVDLVRHPR